MVKRGKLKLKKHTSIKRIISVAAFLFILVTIPLTTYLVQNSKNATKVEAATTLNSLDDLVAIAKSKSEGSLVSVNIPESVYKTAYTEALRSYVSITKNSSLGEPYNTELIGSKKIRGEFLYGAPFERKPVIFYHYYYIDENLGAIYTKLTGGTLAGRTMSPAELGTIESETNKIFNHLWWIYNDYVRPTAISNDANFIYLTFRVKSPNPRPSICVSSSKSRSTLTASYPVKITITGNPPVGYIEKFWIAFYNLDNLYSPANPKPIIFNGSHYTNTNCIRSNNSCTFTVKYTDLNKLDQNWGNKYPVKIQVNGYFGLSDGRWSAADPKCVQQFNIVR